jgi:hypothetical protein
MADPFHTVHKIDRLTGSLGLHCLFSRLNNAALEIQECDLLVVGKYEKEESSSGVFSSVDEALDNLITDFVFKKDKFPGVEVVDMR